MARQSTLTKIRQSIAPRKKRGDDSGKFKTFEVIRVPSETHEKLLTLKLALEIMLSKQADLSSLTDEQLETWEMEHLTMEEFMEYLYEVTLRSGRSQLKEALATAKLAMKSREKFGRRMADAVKEVAIALKIVKDIQLFNTEDDEPFVFKQEKQEKQE